MASAIRTLAGAERRRPSRWRAFGPGLVHLLGSTHPNDLVANSMVGATYGYSLLWVLVVAYGLNYCIAEACARYVLVTGESIIEGYGRLGRPVVLALAGAVFVRRHLNNLYLVLLLGTSLDLLWPLGITHAAIVWSVISCGLAFWLMYRGGYRGLERFSRGLLAVLGVSWAVVAAIAHPGIGGMLRGLLVPVTPHQDGAFGSVVLLMALAGTTIGSINHLKYPVYVYERGWRRVEELPRQRADLALSVVGQCGLAMLIQVAAAATLHGRGLQVHSLAELSRVFSAALGEHGRMVIGIGMWVTVLNNYLGSNTGYGLLVADVYERFVYRPRHRTGGEPRAVARRRAYRVILTLFCVPSLYVLFTSWEPFQLAIATSAAFLVLTPLIMAGLWRLTSDPQRMGGHVNRVWSTLAIGLATVVSIYLTWQGALEIAGKLREGGAF